MAWTYKTGIKMPTIRLRLVLVILIVLAGMIPSVIQGSILIGSFGNSQIDARKIEIHNRCLILSNQLSRAGYLKSVEKDRLIESDIETIADLYNGRIAIVDSSYRIIKDTFGIAEGKTNIAEEIIKCFDGEDSNKYNKAKNYIAQTIPIYDSDQKNIEGVILITSSTEGISNVVESASENMIILEVIFASVLITFGIFAAILIMKPLEELKNQVFKVSGGNLNQKIEQNTYRVTADISKSITMTLDKLKAVDQSRDEFVSNVSHELKTPITSIRVLADSLMGMDDVPQDLYKEFMNDISDEIDREGKIIDDLLSLVKRDKSVPDLDTKPVDISAMLEQILKRLRPISNRRNIEIKLESMRAVIAEVDEVKFSLALSNLVENAVKYNRDDGWVKVSVDADHKFCYIKVSDSGVGIPEEFQESIFERFFRVDKARSRETGGTGLGLAITKNIILMHQGRIKVQSNEGEGTTFTVRVPLTYISANK